MESRKLDHFLAILNLVHANKCVEEFGISPQLYNALRWYLKGPPAYSRHLYEILRKEVMDARDLVDQKNK